MNENFTTIFSMTRFLSSWRKRGGVEHWFADFPEILFTPGDGNTITDSVLMILEAKSQSFDPNIYFGERNVVINTMEKFGTPWSNIRFILFHLKAENTSSRWIIAEYHHLKNPKAKISFIFSNGLGSPRTCLDGCISVYYQYPGVVQKGFCSK